MLPACAHNAALPYRRATPLHQARAYNHYLPAVRSEWLAIWDADEYVFGRDGRQPPAQTVLSDFIVHVKSTLHTYSSTPL